MPVQAEVQFNFVRSWVVTALNVRCLEQRMNALAHGLSEPGAEVWSAGCLCVGT